MSERILFLAHTDDSGRLPKIALEALQAAVELKKQLSGSHLFAGIVGKDAKQAAVQMAGSEAESCGVVSAPDFHASRYATDRAAFEALVKKANATIVIAPSTSRICRTIPGVAFRMKGKIDTRVNQLKVAGGQIQIQRWYYRQRMFAMLSRSNRPWFLVLDSGVFPAFQSAGSSVSVEEITVPLDASLKRTVVVGVQAPAASTQTIRPDANVLFVAGAGWTKKQADGQPHLKEAEQLILGFLNQTQASLGSSKSLVDQSSEGHQVLPFMSHLNQVGQTGSSPRHPKGLATCCHGEEPHVVGWRFINERRAVNTDAGCGWAQGKADVLYVADAFQVMEKVNSLLSGKS